MDRAAWRVAAEEKKKKKDAEKARTERLDKALSEVESVLGKMKEANEARETESSSAVS